MTSLQLLGLAITVFVASFAGEMAAKGFNTDYWKILRPWIMDQEIINRFNARRLESLEQRVKELEGVE